MVMNYITRCDTEETEIEFTVQGRKVVGIFPTGDNSGIYQYLKRILVNTYIDKTMLKRIFLTLLRFMR